jgi:quercetin dioxygenase-like cupin family protein
MNTLKRLGMRRAVISLGFAGLFVAINAIPGAATPSVGFSSVILARGTEMSRASLPLKHGLDIVVAKITLIPGGSSGWHSHPGGAIATIQQGEITFYSPVVKGHDERGQSQSDEEGGSRHPNCVITKYTAGQSFVELPGEVGFAKNTGSIDTIIVAVFPGVPVGVVGGQRIDQPNPGTCGI